MMIPRERIQAVLDRVRPFLHADGGAAEFEGSSPISLDDRLLEVEAALIGWALKATGGNKSKAAALLQVKRSTLGDRINRCGLGRGGNGDRAPRSAVVPGEQQAS